MTFLFNNCYNNHLGTPQELTDENGEVIWANYEFAWGGRYTHHYTTQSLNGYDILEHELQPIRFQGQFYDNETGLHYNRFRYYDSDVGMFIQRDPIGLLGGTNIYQYADNPVMWIDPFGLCTDTSSSKDKKGRLRIDPNGRFSQSEINSAYYVASKGNDVQLRAPVGTRAEGKTSDLVVNGKNYDVYTPEASNPSRIISAIAKKNSQATGVVLDLSKSSVDVKSLGDIVKRVNGTGARNITDVIVWRK